MSPFRESAGNITMVALNMTADLMVKGKGKPKQVLKDGLLLVDTNAVVRASVRETSLVVQAVTTELCVRLFCVLVGGSWQCSSRCTVAGLWWRRQ